MSIPGKSDLKYRVEVDRFWEVAVLAVVICHVDLH